MSSGSEIRLRRLNASEADRITGLLQAGSAEYSAYFRPFPYDSNIIRNILEHASRDSFFGVEIGDGKFELAGFYMLRGLDEGFADPMYGVYIGQRFQRLGLARLTMRHAESFCR